MHFIIFQFESCQEANLATLLENVTLGKHKLLLQKYMSQDSTVSGKCY